MSENDPEDSLSLAARDLLRRVRQRADSQVRHALVIAIDLQRGYRPAEIRARHALTEDEYRVGYRWARDALDQMRQETAAPV